MGCERADIKLLPLNKLGYGKLAGKERRNLNLP